MLTNVRDCKVGLYRHKHPCAILSTILHTPHAAWPHACMLPVVKSFTPPLPKHVLKEIGGGGGTGT